MEQKGKCYIKKVNNFLAGINKNCSLSKNFYQLNIELKLLN